MTKKIQNPNKIKRRKSGGARRHTKNKKTENPEKKEMRMVGSEYPGEVAVKTMTAGLKSFKWNLVTDVTPSRIWVFSSDSS